LHEVLGYSISRYEFLEFVPVSVALAMENSATVIGGGIAMNRTTAHDTSLAMARAGEKVRIARMEGGHCLLSRLASLGFTPGAPLTVVQNFGHGPLIVNLRETRIALGRGEAAKILVEPIGGNHDG
jgi:ferrous iron transport protein A